MADTTFKRLPYERPLLNVDGNHKQRASLNIRSRPTKSDGHQTHGHELILTDLGHTGDLRRPMVQQTTPTWLGTGWIDTPNSPSAYATPTPKATVRSKRCETYLTPDEFRSSLVGRSHCHDQIARQTKFLFYIAEEPDKPNMTRYQEEYRSHQQVSAKKQQTLPKSLYMGPRNRTQTGCTIYTPQEERFMQIAREKKLQELQKFVKEHLAKGYIRPWKALMPHSFSLLKRKMESYDQYRISDA